MQDKFLASEYSPSAPDAAGFHIIPVPLEQSVSYGGGTAQGPQALLAASHQLEAWESGFAPGEAGFFTAEPVDCSGPVTDTLDRIESAVAHAIACKAVPVVLVCASGARANRAVAVAKKLGYDKAEALAGGLKAWREASLPIEKA